MGQKPTETGPIAGEPALMKHIGYALDLMDMVIRNSHHEVDIQDLIKIQHHLINAKYTAPKIDEDDGSCEGEMQAEAEAERQADAALELSAELASCDWGAWE